MRDRGLSGREAAFRQRIERYFFESRDLHFLLGTMHLPPIDGCSLELSMRLSRLRLPHSNNATFYRTGQVGDLNRTSDFDGCELGHVCPVAKIEVLLKTKEADSMFSG